MALVALVGSTAVAGSGCGRNAFLELEVVLPPSTGGELFAVVAFAPGGQAFDAVWAGDQTLEGVALSPSSTTSRAVSVEAPGDAFETPVEVKVTFCKGASCTAPGDDRAPEARLLLERAFYEGKRTSFRWVVPCVPAGKGATCSVVDRDVRVVPKCEVAGCREGSVTSYCVGDRHFCEP